MLLQISCLSSATNLDNQDEFPHHIQISASERNLVYGFFGIIQEFKWNRVTIIIQDENLFTEVCNE